HIPDGCLTGAGITEDPVWVAVAVKVAYGGPGNEARCWRRRRCRRIYQIVTNDIEVDPFGRCRGDIGKLVGANECVLHKRMVLRARLAQPITKIARRSLIETNDVGVAAIDREIT